MRAQVCRLAIGLLLAHATLGCGWHHAHHAAASSFASGSDALVLDAHGCCDSHDAAPCLPTQESPAAPCPGHLDCQVRCIYVQPERVQVDDQQQVQLFLDGALAGASQLDDIGLVQVVVHRSDGPLPCGSLRRHLVFQLLLI